MIYESFAILRELNVPAERILAEVYFSPTAGPQD
jgi:hypothetical protein